MDIVDKLHNEIARLNGNFESYGHLSDYVNHDTPVSVFSSNLLSDFSDSRTSDDTAVIPNSLLIDELNRNITHSIPVDVENNEISATTIPSTSQYYDTEAPNQSSIDKSDTEAILSTVAPKKIAIMSEFHLSKFPTNTSTDQIKHYITSKTGCEPNDVNVIRLTKKIRTYPVCRVSTSNWKLVRVYRISFAMHNFGRNPVASNHLFEGKGFAIWFFRRLEHVH